MGGSEKLGQQLQGGRKGCHLRDLLVMLNQHVGLWEILVCQRGTGEAPPTPSGGPMASERNNMHFIIPCFKTLGT